MTVSPAPPNTAPLARPVTALHGVGAERASQLARLKVFTVEDLLLHRPRRYEDRRHFRPIADLALDQPATTRGTVVALGLKRFRRGSKSVLELILDDGTARLHCRWWNLPFMEKYFRTGDEVVVFGKPASLKPRTIDHPETEVVEPGEENFIHLNRITPVYPLTEGLPQRWLRSLIWRTLRQHQSLIADPWPAPPPVPMPRGASPARNPPPGPPWLTRAEAIRRLHCPDSLDDAEAARRRLALDEFAGLQLEIRQRRLRFEAKALAFPCGGDNRLIKPFLRSLGFRLTDSQARVLREIRADLRAPHPMRRLLQGDVGSGKTVVAACAALMALESGFSVALMVPTEVLAEQHCRNFGHWFKPLGIPVHVQTGAHKTVATRPRASASTPDPRPPALFIGTHALLTEQFLLPHLGLVIIDEQHKFGVAQREQLVRKGRYPHVLVMTATPIPRTLALTVYGDLDVSVIDRPPPGRGAVKTFVRTAGSLPKVWEFLRGQLARGRQAYVICPRVDAGEREEIKAVTAELARLRPLLAPFQVGLIHGRLKAVDKEKVMAAFRANILPVLLATALIEVGVDVPNASVMVIEDADRFGLAQLHQLRGRIGRANHDSYCILIANTPTAEARRRLAVLERCADGFRIAEADLALRGPGELLGREQSGLPAFRFGDLAGDGELIRLARDWAARLGTM